MAANIIHSNGLPDDLYRQHVGKLIIVSSASPDWVEDYNVDESDSNTLYVHFTASFDHGMFKHKRRYNGPKHHVPPQFPSFIPVHE